jgi:hypothetical protein
LGFELRVSTCKVLLYCLSHASRPFHCGYFEDRVSLFAQASVDYDPHCKIMLPAAVGMTGMHHHAWLFLGSH